MMDRFVSLRGGKRRFNPLSSASHTAVLLVVGFMVLAGWYSLVIPPGEGVDEVPHFAYVRYVADAGALPIQPWRDNGRTMDVWMGHHPPLYYVLGALLSGWTDTRDWDEVLQPNPRFEWTEREPRYGWNVILHPPGVSRFQGTLLALHYLRLWSVVMGAITLLATYRIGRLLVPDRPWISLTAVALIAFNPSFLALNSSIHHDALIVMLFALSLWWMVRALASPPSAGMAIAGGILLAAALLTKLSALSLLPLFGVTLLLVAHSARDARLFFRLALPLYGVALLGAGWWYLRNQLLYGDPIGWQMFLETHSHMLRGESYSWAIFRDRFLAQLGRTYWGAFGYMHILLPSSIHRALWALTALGLAGSLVALLRHRSLLLKDGRWRGWVVALGAFVLVFASFIRFSIATVGAGHGRYLFTVAAPAALVVSIGLNTLTAMRAQRLIAGVVTLGLASYAVIAPLRYVLPRYAPPVPVPPAALEGTQRSGARFGDALELVGYTLTPPIVAPGDDAELTLYWRALGERRPDVGFSMTLRDRYGSAFHTERFWPLPAHPTVVWERDALYVTRRTLPVPSEVPPGAATLELRAWVGEPPVPLPVLPMTPGTHLGVLALPALDIGQGLALDPAAVAPTHQREVRFGEHVVLVGYDVVRHGDSPEVVLLDLYWKADRQPEQNYTVFAQLLDARRQVVVQQNNEPNRGRYPTTIWRPGTVVKDSYRLVLPPDLQPGHYALIVGMYELPSVARLAVSEAGTDRGDAIQLLTLPVE